MSAPTVHRAVIPPEPEGDRPAVADNIGDVWQRRGPIGTATWYAACAQLTETDAADLIDPRDPQPFARGRCWAELIAVFGDLVTIHIPSLPTPEYTGELPAQDVKLSDAW